MKQYPWYVHAIFRVSNIGAFYLMIELQEKNRHPLLVIFPGILFVLGDLIWYIKENKNWTKSYKVAHIILIIVWLICMVLFYNWSL